MKNEPCMIKLFTSSDSRGYLSVVYDAMIRNGCAFDLKQVNQGFSHEAYTLRGMHFQMEPFSQAKIVQVLRGSIYNVAVNIRRDSVEFGRYYAAVLTQSDSAIMYIPRGYAHGYLTLEKDVLVQWLVDREFCIGAAKSLRYDDYAIFDGNGGNGISWPGDKHDYIISEKDRNGLSIAEISSSFELFSI